MTTAGAARSGPGTNLRWSNCFGDGGAQNKTSACSANAGRNLLVGSFEMPSSLAGVAGVEIRLEIAVAGGSLPPWWRFNAGECRQGALALNGTLSEAAANCVDWAGGASAGGLAAYDENAFGAGTAHVLAGFAVPVADAQALEPGVEYFAFNAALSNSRSTGEGNCAGCSAPACIVLSSITVAVPPEPDQPGGTVVITGPANGAASDLAIWQGGMGTPSLPRGGCAPSTPARDSTWGAVSPLHR